MFGLYPGRQEELVSNAVAFWSARRQTVVFCTLAFTYRHSKEMEAPVVLMAEAIRTYHKVSSAGLLLREFEADIIATVYCTGQGQSPK